MSERTPTHVTADCASSRGLIAYLLSRKDAPPPPDPWDHAIGKMCFWIREMADPDNRCRAHPLFESLRSTPLPTSDARGPSNKHFRLLEALRLAVSTWQKSFTSQGEFCRDDGSPVVRVHLFFGVDEGVKTALHDLGLTECFHRFELVFRVTGLVSSQLLYEHPHRCDLLSDSQVVVLRLPEIEPQVKVEVRHGLGLRAVCVVRASGSGEVRDGI